MVGQSAAGSGSRPQSTAPGSDVDSWHTYDGLQIAGLYTAHDELGELPLPGEFPFVRGSEGTRGGRRGWHVAARFGGDAADVNRQILAALENGVSALWLEVGGSGMAVSELGRALDGVLFDAAPLILDSGAAVSEAAARIFALLDEYRTTNRGDIQLWLGDDPLGNRLAGQCSTAVDLDPVVALAQRAIARAENVRAITVSGLPAHEAGASDAQELGIAVAAGLAYLRALTDAGVDIADALGQFVFRLAATDDQFATMAKFRAGRQLWARVAHEVGAPEFGNAPQHAVTSLPMMTRRDPSVNLLRTTVAACGAGIGGADVVTVLPFDIRLPAGELDVPACFSERMARNISLLLLEEAQLGQVRDPAGGSWYVESRTAALASRAWSVMQEVERAGGYLAALHTGMLAGQVSRSRDRRTADIAHRRRTVTGISEYPNLAERVLSPEAHVHPDTSYGGGFEELRDRSDAYVARTGHRPLALLVSMNSIAAQSPRTAWVRNFLACGGIEACDAEISAEQGAAEAETTVAVLCGGVMAAEASASGAEVPPAGPLGAVVAWLREAGVTTVLLAGNEVSGQPIGQNAAAAGHGVDVDGVIGPGMDAVAVLSDLLTKMGA